MVYLKAEGRSGQYEELQWTRVPCERPVIGFQGIVLMLEVRPDSNPEDKGKMKAGSLCKVEKVTGEQNSVLLWDSILTTASES